MAALLDAGALGDPLVGGVEAGLESALVTTRSGRAVPQPVMMAPRTPAGTAPCAGGHAVRSQAIGWLVVTRSPSTASMPDEDAREGGADLLVADLCRATVPGASSQAGLGVGGRRRRRRRRGSRPCARWRRGARPRGRRPRRPRPPAGVARAVSSLSRSSGVETDERAWRPATVRLAMPVSTLPGPSSTKVRGARLGRGVSRVWRQRTGLQSWAPSRPPHSSAAVWARASTLAYDGQLGLAELGGVDGLAQPFAGRGHERRVEGAADRHRHHLLGAELLGDRRRPRRPPRAHRRSRPGRERCSWRPRRRRRPGRRRPRRRRRRDRAPRPSCRCGRSAASRMASPRSATRRRPSSKARAPEATSAVYSPRLWPAAAAGSTPRRSTASSTTRLVRKVDSWALSVSFSSSASVCSSRRLEVAAEHGRRLDDQLPRRVVAPGLAHAGLLGSLAGEGEHDHRWREHLRIGRLGRWSDQGQVASDDVSLRIAGSARAGVDGATGRSSGAAGGIRTLKPLRAAGFEPALYAGSSTAADCGCAAHATNGAG